ncbi:MAG TPA: PIN domain-containing protein [Patescibacteria group bacterium]|nr:PIN domain-containing protein [Patescibacteria group bacterium]
MTQSKKVFIGSDVLIAFIDRAKDKHEQAAAFFRYFAQSEYQIFIDYHSIIDVYNHIFTLISPSLSKDFLRTINLSNLNIVYPDENDAKAALKTLVTYQSNDLSYPQALMACLASRRNISFLCTFSYLPTLFALEIFYLPM